jgi:lipoyl(octanoyl) transferase 2
MANARALVTSAVKLQHIHLPGRISYPTSLNLQDSILSQHWAHRATLKDRLNTTQTNTPAPSPPPPYLLTFSTNPTYTVGRRHLESNPLSAAQISYLTRNGTAAAFHPSSRGGLLTYHGPGQLTAYPIIDLRRWGLSARCYVRLLEDAVIRTCNTLLAYSSTASADNTPETRPTGRSPTDPGVWMLRDDGLDHVSDRKICALGVQVTRGVGWHGIGLNVHDEPIEVGQRERFSFRDQLPSSSAARDTMGDGVEGGQAGGHDNKGYLSYGFGRIVACGLEGKSTTWLAREGAEASRLELRDVARRLAHEVVVGLNAMRKTRQETDGVEHTVLGLEQVRALDAGESDLGYALATAAKMPP